MNLETIFWSAVLGLIICIGLSMFGHNYGKAGYYGPAKYETLGWIALGLSLVLFVVVLGSGITLGKRHSCSTWAHRNGYEWHYSGAADGCQVKIAGQWISSDQVIVNTQK